MGTQLIPLAIVGGGVLIVIAAIWAAIHYARSGAKSDVSTDVAKASLEAKEAFDEGRAASHYSHADRLRRMLKRARRSKSS